MKTKKGYTLIELLLAISITSMISAIFIGAIQMYKEYNNKVLVDYCNNSIMMFINHSRQFSKFNRCSSYIKFSLAQQYMQLSKVVVEENGMTRLQLVKTLYLPKGFKFSSLKLKNKKRYLNIHKDGNTGDAGSIHYLDMMKKDHTITIGVGSFYVDIKD